MTTKLYVGNLSYNTKEEALQSLFASVGTVTSVKIVMDRMTGRSKGFGFVEMDTAENAEEAISRLDGQELDGRSLRISLAKPQEEKERRPFSGGPRGDRGPRGGGDRGGFNRDRGPRSDRGDRGGFNRDRGNRGGYDE